MNGRMLQIACCFLLVSVGMFSLRLQAANEPVLPVVDELLDRADHGRLGMMFLEQETEKIDPQCQYIVITSARDSRGRPAMVHLKHGTTAVFRTDVSTDDFTKAGGWYWRDGQKVEHQSKFENAEQPQTNNPGAWKGFGALIMVVYQMDGTIHWYRLGLDVRC